MRSVSRGQDWSTARGRSRRPDPTVSDRGRRTGIHFGGKCWSLIGSHGLRLGVFLGALCGLGLPAQAQYGAPGGFGFAPGALTTAPGAYGAPGPSAALPSAVPAGEIPAPPPWLLTPGFTLGESYTDNVNLGPPGSRVSDFVTTLGPSLALSGQTSRVTVALTYDPQELLFLRSTPSNVLQQNLLGTGSAILWPETLFFEGSASIAQAYTHPTGPIGPTTLTTSNNLTTVYATNASPYLRQHLGSVSDSESRYRFSTASTDATGIAPEDTHELRQTFISGEAFGRLGWELTGDFTRLNRGHDPTDPLSGISSKDYLSRADFSYPLYYSLSAIGGVGYERVSDPTLTVVPKGVIWDAGFQYQPNQLVAVSFTYGERFNTNDIEFNGTYNLDPQLRLSALYTETIQTSLQQLAGTTSQLTPVVDPTTGAITFVSGPVTTPGAITGTALTASASGITSGAYLAKSATLGATLTKARDTYSLTGSYSKTSANSTATIGTTLASRTAAATFVTTAAAVTAERIFGGAFSWDHKLWPDLEGTASSTYYHASFLDGSGRVDNTYTVSLGLTYTLSQTASATFSLSRSDLKSNIEIDSLVVDTVMATIRKTF